MSTNNLDLEFEITVKLNDEYERTATVDIFADREDCKKIMQEDSFSTEIYDKYCDMAVNEVDEFYLFSDLPEEYVKDADVSYSVILTGIWELEDEQEGELNE